MSKASCLFFCSTAIVKRVISRVFEPIIKRAVNILQDNKGREDTEEIDTIEYRDLKVGMHVLVMYSWFLTKKEAPVSCKMMADNYFFFSKKI